MKDFEICYYHDKNISVGENHTHSYYEIYFFPEENASVFIKDRFYKLWQGDVAILPPETLHRVILHEQRETYSYFAFRISGEYCKKLFQMSKDYEYIIQSVRERRIYLSQYTGGILQHSIYNFSFTGRGTWKSVWQRNENFY